VGREGINFCSFIYYDISKEEEFLLKKQID
jgi:hypothetical protein